MPLDADAINVSVRGVLSSLLALNPNTVRKANQNGPTGNVNEPFSTVLITELTPDGQDEVSYKDDGVLHTLTETISGTRIVIASVQFFRAGALTYAARLGGLLKGGNGLALLTAAGLGLKRVGRLNNLSQEVDTLWEERAQLELELYVSSVEQAPVSTFAGVSVTIKSETTAVTNEVNLDVAS